MMKNLVCVASVAALFLSEGTGFCMPPPSHIDLTKFPATQLDEIVVPLPSEVFNVLDKLGSPNWQEQLRDPVIRNTGERAQIALLLGCVVAEGFVAVEATDKFDRDTGRFGRLAGGSTAVGRCSDRRKECYDPTQG